MCCVWSKIKTNFSNGQNSAYKTKDQKSIRLQTAVFTSNPHLVSPHPRRRVAATQRVLWPGSPRIHPVPQLVLETEHGIRLFLWATGVCCVELVCILHSYSDVCVHLTYLKMRVVNGAKCKITNYYYGMSIFLWAIWLYCVELVPAIRMCGIVHSSCKDEGRKWSPVQDRYGIRLFL